MQYRTPLVSFVLTAGLGGCALFPPPLVYPPESPFTTSCESEHAGDTWQCERSAREHCAKEPLRQHTSSQSMTVGERETTNHIVHWYCPP